MVTDGVESMPDLPKQCLMMERKPAQSIRLAFERSDAAGIRQRASASLSSDPVLPADRGAIAALRAAKTARPWQVRASFPRWQCLMMERKPAQSIRLAFERSDAAGIRQRASASLSSDPVLPADRGAIAALRAAKTARPWQVRASFPNGNA